VTRPSFPTSLVEFQRWFPDDEACYRYLAASRWPDGFICPACGHPEGWRVRRRTPSRSTKTPRPPDRIRIVWECASCHHQTSLTAGTVLDATKLPLKAWFHAAFMVATDKRGMSAVLLDRQLDMGGHMTAWFMLHKLRRAMVNANRTKLGGLVEIDGTYVGGYQPGLKGGRQRKGRKAAMVLAAVELGTQKRRQKDGTEKTIEVSKRVRMEVVRAENGPWIGAFLEAHVEPGSTIRSDGLNDYPPVLATLGYAHDRRVQGNPAKTGQVVPFAHRAISNMKAWLIGTHHGVGRPHLQAYLDEFVFRYNRRGNPEAAFQTLLGLGSRHAPVRRATIRGAADLPYYYEGDEVMDATAAAGGIG
jgi:ISXO2-like transposase domain/Transposase zinc-ribbon domain